MREKSKLVVFAALLLPAAFGCGAAEEEFSDVPQVRTEDIGTDSAGIWGPTVLGRAAVRVYVETSPGSGSWNTCSGTMLNNQTIVTAAHCLPGFSSGTRNTVIEYQGPSGTLVRWFAGGEMFYTVPSGWNANKPSEWDVAIGTLSSGSLSFSDIDFATLYRGGMGGGTHLTQAGYGGSLAGPSGIQRRIVLQVTWNGSQHVKWETDVAAGQMVCKGDSGGPAFRSSGYSDASGPYWDAAGWVVTSIFSGDCDDEGRASKLNSKVDWIRDTVRARTIYTCTDFTTPNGTPASWCWDVE
jgi:hypothetical protein